MSSLLVECWNCGQKLTIRIDKLETARCGSCQQMVVQPKQPQPAVEVVSSLPQEQRTEAVVKEKDFGEKTPPTLTTETASSGIHPAHTITRQDVVTGLSVVFLIAALHQIISSYLYVYWVSSIDEQSRWQVFLQNWDITNHYVAIDFGRTSLTLSFFLFLSLKREIAPVRLRIIGTLVGIAGYIIQDVIDQAGQETVFDHIFRNSKTYLLMALVFLGDFFLLGILSRYLRQSEKPRIKEVTRQNNRPLESKTQTKQGFRIIVVLLGAIPPTLIGAIFPSIVVTVIGFFALAAVIDMRGRIGFYTIYYSVYAVVWFLMYKRSVRQGLRAVKEGESAFGALLDVWNDMLLWLPGASK